MLTKEISRLMNRQIHWDAVVKHHERKLAEAKTPAERNYRRGHLANAKSEYDKISQMLKSAMEEQ